MKSFTTGQRPLQSYDDSQSYDTPNNDSMIQQHRSSYPTQNALVMLLNHAQSCSKKTLGRLIWNTSDFCPRRLARPSHGSLHGSAKTWAKSGQTKEIQSQTPPGHSIGLPGRTAAPERPLYKTTPGRFSAVLCQSHGVFGHATSEALHGAGQSKARRSPTTTWSNGSTCDRAANRATVVV